jgi:hypothetical protein
MSAATRPEVEVDRRIAAAHAAADKASARLAREFAAVHRMIGDSPSGRSGWTRSHAEAVARLAEMVENGERGRGCIPVQVARQLDAVTAAQAAANAANAVRAEVTAEYRGWSRFFLVQGGHVHRTQTCHTLRPTTSVGWLPELSGLTEADAVAAHGAILCTHCFPSAPVEWTNKYDLEAEAKKAARCTGSGSYMDYAQPHRTGYYTSNWATCGDCHSRVTVTSTGKLRAHKPGA